MKKTLNEAQKIYRILTGADVDDGATEPDPFEGLFDDIVDPAPDVEDNNTIVDPPTTSQDKTEETTPTQEVVTTDPVTTEPEVKAEPEVATKPEVQPEPVAEEPVTPQTPEEAEAQVKALHEGFAKQYQLTEEQADQFLTDPAVALPMLAAQLHVNILSQVMQLLQNHLPQQITQVQQMTAKRQEVEGLFKQAWPDLDLGKPEISDVVTEASRLAKQRYPKADMSELIQKTGLIAHALMGTVPQGQGAAPAPAAPAARPNPVSPTPAGAPRQPVKVQTKTEWDEFFDDVISQGD